MKDILIVLQREVSDLSKNVEEHLNKDLKEKKDKIYKINEILKDEESALASSIANLKNVNKTIIEYKVAKEDFKK